MNLKSKDFLLKVGGGSDLEFILKKCPPLDFSVAQQLPDLRHVLSRLWNILEDFPPNTDARLARAKRQLAEELWYDWIYINISTKK